MAGAPGRGNHRPGGLPVEGRYLVEAAVGGGSERLREESG